MWRAAVSVGRMFGVIQRICNVEFEIVSQKTDSRLGVLEVYGLAIGAL
jgi:hypothetical protein